MREAVTRLSERQRIALMLSRFENMSYAEIAETMGLTTKAVKSLLCRARVNLRELLQPYVDSARVAQGDRKMTSDNTVQDLPTEPDDEQLVAYLDGELTGNQREQLEQRLLDDDTLRMRLQQLQSGWDWPGRDAQTSHRRKDGRVDA